MNDRLRGVFNITPTPFNPDGSLDLEGIPQLTEFVLKTGVQGLTILGVMGEGAKLTELERDQVIGAVVETVADRVPVVVGTSHGSTDVCVAHSRRAEALGATAVMVAPPKLSRSSDQAILEHYLRVAEAIPLPIVVQDHPASSGVVISVAGIARIAAEAPQCRYLKLEDEPSPPKVTQVRQADPHIQIFGGLGGLFFLEELGRGAIGTMTGFAFPDILVQIYQYHQAGDLERATELFYRYCPLIRFENQPRLNLSLRKHIYQLRGAITSAQARSPVMSVDPQTLEDLKALWGWLERQ